MLGEASAAMIHAAKWGQSPALSGRSPQPRWNHLTGKHFRQNGTVPVTGQASAATVLSIAESASTPASTASGQQQDRRQATVRRPLRECSFRTNAVSRFSSAPACQTRSAENSSAERAGSLRVRPTPNTEHVYLMPPEGVEPPPTYVDMDLNHARLPIPPRRRFRPTMMSNQPALGKASSTRPIHAPLRVAAKR